MLERLISGVLNRRRTVLAVAALIVVLAAALGFRVESRLTNGGYYPPSAPSVAAANSLTSDFHTGAPNLTLLVTAKSGTVDSPAVAAAAKQVTDRVLATGLPDTVVSYWSLDHAPALRSQDGRQGLILVHLPGPEEVVEKNFPTVVPHMTEQTPEITVTAAGPEAVNYQLSQTTADDLLLAEAIAFPVTTLLLLFIFRGVVAALLPMAIAACSVPLTLAALTLLTSLTQVNTFALNLTTALGLGLAIDYSLLIVSRYRQELADGHAPDDAVARTLRTAGRTVLFSALTVAGALTALLVFPMYYLRSFAYAGISVVVISAVGAVVVLPALIAVLGRNVDRWSVRRRPPAPVGTGFWHRMATTVMRRPLPIGGAVLAVVLLLGAPFLTAQFGQPDDSVLPSTATSRQADADIRANFDANQAYAIPVVAARAGDPAKQHDTVASYAESLSRLPGVGSVQAFTGVYRDGHLAAVADPTQAAAFSNGHGTWLSVVPARTVQVEGASGTRLTRAVRAAPSPWPTVVGGYSAYLIDTQDTLSTLLPWALAIVAVVTLLVVFLLFGSVLVPVKALLLNLLSLTATFGAMVFVFQDGHGSGLLDFTASGHLDINTPVLMFCVAFGLSMDYEVFLLSRIREERARGADTTEAVARGLEHTGRIVTAAALVMAVVFIAFSTAHISFVKMLGVGMTLAVLMDATLIRGALVPAFMKVAGDANWWAPEPLRRLHTRFGLHEPSTGDPTPRRVSQPALPIALETATGELALSERALSGAPATEAAATKPSATKPSATPSTTTTPATPADSAAPDAQPVAEAPEASEASAVRTSGAKESTTKAPAAKATTPRKPSARKAPAQKPSAQKSPGQKSPAQKSATPKPTPKKSTPKAAPVAETPAPEPVGTTDTTTPDTSETDKSTPGKDTPAKAPAAKAPAAKTPAGKAPARKSTARKSTAPKPTTAEDPTTKRTADTANSTAAKAATPKATKARAARTTAAQTTTPEDRQAKNPPDADQAAQDARAQDAPAQDALAQGPTARAAKTTSGTTRSPAANGAKRRPAARSVRARDKTADAASPDTATGATAATDATDKTTAQRTSATTDGPATVGGRRVRPVADRDDNGRDDAAQTTSPTAEPIAADSPASARRGDTASADEPTAHTATGVPEKAGSAAARSTTRTDKEPDGS